MDRRVFLREAIWGAGVVACGVGGLWVRCARARSHVVEQLMDSARPVLDKYALDEQEQIPVSAGNKVRAYFDQNCLNTAEFVAEIGTPEFRKKLGKIRPGDRRQQELLTVFYQRVPGAIGVGEFIHAQAREFGRQLDEHWSACCAEIAAQWQGRMQTENGPPFDASEFDRRVTPLLRYQVEQTVQRARRVTDEPGWRESIRSFSVEALEPGPEIALKVGEQTVKVPEFAANAWRHLFEKVLEYLGNPNWECQRAMTVRLAELGKTIGAEFEKELRRRLNDLHSWRENAVRLAAEQHAAERIGFFGGRG